MNLADLHNMYYHSLILHRNKPCKVMDINDRGDVLLWDLNDQRSKKVKWDEKNFQAPTRRLGMVNINNTVVFANRIPVRKYWVGLHRNNIEVNSLLNEAYGDPTVAKEQVKLLQDKAVADALFNRYPSFEEAYETVSMWKMAVAFDKQFAIDTRKAIWYKRDIVGKARGKTIDTIEFDKNKQHLSLLLNGEWKKPLSRVS